MKITNHIIDLATKATLEFIDITDDVLSAIKKSGIANGIVNIQSLHTTMAIIVNEAEPLLIGDMKKMLERVAPEKIEYDHDNFDIRTVNIICATANAKTATRTAKPSFFRPRRCSIL